MSIYTELRTLCARRCPGLVDFVDSVVDDGIREPFRLVFTFFWESIR